MIFEKLVFTNALSYISSSFEGKIIFSNLVSLKQPKLKISIVSGYSISQPLPMGPADVKFLSPLNKRGSISLIFAFIITFFKFLHTPRLPPPILLTVSGIVISVKLLHVLKSEPPR